MLQNILYLSSTCCKIYSIFVACAAKTIVLKKRSLSMLKNGENTAFIMITMRKLSQNNCR